MPPPGSLVTRTPPPGILFISGRRWRIKTYRYIVLFVTFVAYVCFHASRKPTGIVKSVLYPEPGGKITQYKPWPMGEVFVKDRGIVGKKKKNEGWAPFNQPDGTSKLGEIDVAFLACYSVGMYVSGHLGDTLDLRLFLTVGMFWSGVFVGLFGMGYFWNIHAFSYYLIVQMIAGLFQATGWPSVVAVIGNWFGKRKRGLIMGVWNAHTSVGNISGSLLAVSVLKYGWGWSFIVPGALIMFGGLFVYLFLAAYPEDVGLTSTEGSDSDLLAAIHPDEEAQITKGDVTNAAFSPDSLRTLSGASVRTKSVGLLEAFFIPGVIPFSLCLFFAKLVAYTFLYWLPFYLSQTEIGGEYVSVESAGNLSTLFDVGGIIGGVLAGYVSDKLNARATTAASFMYAAIPTMLLYRIYGSISMNVNIALMVATGLLVNGPYALITTAVSADLGTHSSLRGDSRALATVTAIIDGTGSVGAALGPLLTGFLSTMGWNAVFAMLVLGAAIAGLLLSRLVIDEIAERSHRPEPVSIVQQNPGAAASQPLLSGDR